MIVRIDEYAGSGAGSDIDRDRIASGRAVLDDQGCDAGLHVERHLSIDERFIDVIQRHRFAIDSNAGGLDIGWQGERGELTWPGGEIASVDAEETPGRHRQSGTGGELDCQAGVVESRITCGVER